MPRLNLFLKVTVVLVFALSFAGCRSTKRDTPPPPDAPTQKIKYNAKYDAEIKEIFTLARVDDWETAEQRATELLKQDPTNPSLERVYSWVIKESQGRRAKALEDEIRHINTRDSVFNPTPKSLLTERKNRGLPPRKDLRDAVEQIEATPYVPDTYGRTIQKKGPLYDFDTARGRMPEVLDKEISIHLDDVTLEHIIFTIGQAHGINFVADKSIPAFQQKLSVNMQKVRFGEFLNYVSRNLDIQFQVGDDLIWVVDVKDPKRMLEETRFYRLRKGFVMPAQFAPSETTKVTVTVPATNTRTETETQKIEKFVRDTAPDKPSIETAIKQFFTGSSHYIDYERNLIVARGTHDQLLVLEKIIEEFDKPLQQVLIEARFITVSQAAFLQLGATWETGRGNIVDRSPTDFTGLGDNIGTLGLGLQETFTNVLSRGNLSATLTALEQSGESQTLSAPRITLVNNLPATISDGKVQYYYEEYSVKTQILERRSASTLVPVGKPAKLTSGVSLDVLASIGGDGRSIMLALKPEVNQDVRLVPFATVTDLDEAGRVASSFEIRLPESRTQSMATRVIVQSGQTVVMGGVLEREQRTFVESVPILGNIPIIGAAFRKRTEVDRPRYLLIFVTATLVSDSGEFLSYDESD
jgi:type IV pilus assembly protein PilQ